MKKSFAKLAYIVTVAGAVAGLPGTAVASGFAILEQSVGGLGNAFAGGAAIAEDATTVFFNPAGMTRVPDSQFVGALHFIDLSIEFSDKGSQHVPPFPLSTIPLAGGNGGNAGGGAVVPNAYFVKDLAGDWVMGLGINAPFGLATEYEPDWQGRYFGIESSVKTININPALAFKINNKLSVGAGINLQYIEGTLTNAIDYSAVCIALLPLLTCTGLTLDQLQLSDGILEVEGDDTSYGANLGVLFELSKNTRVGAAYRSQVKHTLEGDGKFVNAPSGLVTTLAGFGQNVFVDADVKLDVDLPETLSVSGFHQLSKKIALMADITMTKWSRLEEVRIVFNTDQPDAVEAFNWQDTMRYSLGATYGISDTLVARAGIAFDEAPVPSKEDRGVRLPDSDRTWIAVGLGMKLAGGIKIDVGLAHLMVDDAEIDRIDSFGHQLTGDYELGVDMLSVQGTMEF